MIKPSCHILMIDDDEEDFIITKDILSDITTRKYHINWESNYEAGLHSVLTQKFDLCFVDYRIGIHSGLDLIKEAIAKGCEIPFILLTGQNNEEVDEQALQAGAVDYLVKGNISPQYLERTIRYCINQSQHLQKIKQLNIDLEKRVRDRTLVLEEALDALEQSKEELHIALEKEKDLNDLKTRFVSMASHEFRTPLATILSSLSLIAKYGEIKDFEKQVKHITRIKSAVNNMTDILSDILSISKLEEGKVAIQTESLHIPEFILEICHELEGITKSGQQLMLEQKGTPVPVQSDKKILRHILHNLISNAIKFSPENSSIELRYEQDEKNFTIQVQDKGIGISEEDQKHLFQRFFRGQNATNIQGTGLGLNIVLKYVELLGGTISCQSALEKGTCFSISLPCEIHACSS